MTATLYPSAIQRACAALDELPVFRNLPDGYWRVLVRLVKKISVADPMRPITASRETLARESGKSEETVHRVLRWLEAHGLITRVRHACAHMRGSVSLIVPTDAFILALGLSARPVSLDGSVSRNEAISLKEQPHAQERSGECLADTSSRARTHVRVGKFSIPEDLAWLAEQGIQPSAICHLMRLAKGFGKRLSDVAAYARTYIERMEAKRAFAYLRALLPKEIDFAWLTRERRKQVEAKSQRQALDAVLRSHQGQTLHGPDGLRVEVLSNGVLAYWRDGRYLGAAPATQDFLAALKDGRLRPRRA